MRKFTSIDHLRERVEKGIEELVKQQESQFIFKNSLRLIDLGGGCFLYKHFRLCFHGSSFDVQYTKVDRGQYLTVYRFGKGRGVRGYYYKTALLLNLEIENFIKECQDGLYH